MVGDKFASRRQFCNPIGHKTDLFNFARFKMTDAKNEGWRRTTRHLQGFHCCAQHAIDIVIEATACVFCLVEDFGDKCARWAFETAEFCDDGLFFIIGQRGGLSAINLVFGLCKGATRATFGHRALYC